MQSWSKPCARIMRYYGQAMDSSAVARPRTFSRQALTL